MIQQSAQEPKPRHHLLLPTVSQIKTSVGTVATGHEKCIISGCSALPGSLRRLQWRKMLQRDGWAFIFGDLPQPVPSVWLQYAGLLTAASQLLSTDRPTDWLSVCLPVCTRANRDVRPSQLPAPASKKKKKSNLEWVYWATFCAHSSLVHSSHSATWKRDSVGMFFSGCLSATSGSWIVMAKNWEVK